MTDDMRSSPLTLQDFFQLHLSEDDACDLELCPDDVSTASSDISIGAQDDVSRNHYPTNYLRNFNAVYHEHSWTIHCYERNRQAGDSIWFRAWRNDKHDLMELEDDEILSFVENNIQCYPDALFYLKMTQRGGFTSVAAFDTTLISRCLNRILEQAQERDRLCIPSKTSLEQDILREQRARKGFVPWLRSVRA